MRFYVAPDDSGFATASSPWLVPSGWAEVTQGEYEERLAVQRAVAEERSAAVLAGDAVPNTG